MMSMKKYSPFKNNAQHGMTLIEVMIAMVVITIGMSAVLSLMMYTLSSNNRNRQDVNAATIAILFLRHASTVPAFQNLTVTVTDCQGTSFNINTTANSVTTPGPPLLSSGKIDFTSSYTTAGYSAQYQICEAGGQFSTYDVRWNIQTITAYSKLITVGVMKVGASGNAGSNGFTIPVTMRSIAGS